MSKNRKKPAELKEAALDQVTGGLPAVQKVREAAARQSTTTSTHGTGAGGGKVSMQDMH